MQEWDLVHMLDSARYGMTDYDLTSDPFAQSASNWAHNNGIVEWGDDYLATARYQGIFKFNKLEVLSGLYRLMGIGEINT